MSKITVKRAVELARMKNHLLVRHLKTGARGDSSYVAMLREDIFYWMQTARFARYNRH